ncbi:MAG: glycosyltransferase [Acidobacteriota bacterium]
MRTLVSLVTFNDESLLEACLRSVLAQSTPVHIKIFDNDSRDRTCRIAREFDLELYRSPRNIGFCAGHNYNLRDGDFESALLLNADVILAKDYLQQLLAACKEVERAGMAGGKLLRMDSEGRPVLRHGLPVLDSAGIYFTPSQRHFDRGSGEEDRGQYDRRQLVFGITGAALLCRKEMLEELRYNGEYLDEDFFAYREDADLAWRAQLKGWNAVYEPSAQGFHCRRVLPSRRRRVSLLITYHSVKNRFLMRAKNMDWAVRKKCFPYLWVRDLGILLYLLCIEWSSLPALVQIWRLRKTMRAKRAAVQSSRTTPPHQIASWFAFKPQAREPSPVPIPRPLNNC